MPPRKRKTAKKPSSDESESDSFHDESDEEVKPAPRRNKKKQTEVNQDENNNDNEVKDDDVTPSTEIIKEGANDLMHLPIEVIQEELIRRGYYPKMIKKFSQQYLVSILRDETSQVHETRRNRGDLVTKKGASMRNSHKNKPIFNPNDSGENEPNAIQHEEEEEDDDNEQTLPDVKPSEFK